MLQSDADAFLLLSLTPPYHSILNIPLTKGMHSLNQSVCYIEQCPLHHVTM